MPSAPGARYRRHRGTAAAGGARDAAAAPADDEPPGGYWIAGFDPEAARHGTHRVYRREELSRVVLFSDGFSGQREALLGAEEPCLQELYQQLRQREAADSRCNRYPRLKPGDDVSGIVALF